MSNVLCRKSQRESESFLHAIQKLIKFPHCFEMLLWALCMRQIKPSHFRCLQCPFSLSLLLKTSRISLFSCSSNYFGNWYISQFFVEGASYYSKNNIAGTSVMYTAISVSLELCRCRSWFCAILSLTFRKAYLIIFVIWLQWFCRDFYQTIIFLTLELFYMILHISIFNDK